jgi:hypothetical protein
MYNIGNKKQQTLVTLHLSASNVSFDDAEVFRNKMRYYNTIAIEISSGLNQLQSINDGS